MMSCDWALKGEELKVKVTVPPNSKGRVILPGLEKNVGSGTWEYTCNWKPEAEWPPKAEQLPIALGAPQKPDVPC